MTKKTYPFNVQGFGMMWHTGDNAVRVRRNLHSIGWWTWPHRKRKRAAGSTCRATLYNKQSHYNRREAVSQWLD